jgi:hypothetical protein
MFRCSSAYPLFLGDAGLTAKQQETLDGLLDKIKLTDKQATLRDELIAKRDAPYELSTGAKTLIEEAVEEELWGYKPSFSSRETTKGIMVENDSIELYNRLNFTNHTKSEISLSYKGILTGHPDIANDKTNVVIDIKSPWSKKTFPKTLEKARNSQYEWQVKLYLFMLTKTTGVKWSQGRIAYMLVNTPEELIPESDSDSLHYMDDLPDNMRQVIVPVDLTDDDIKKIDKRLEIAIDYANKYRQRWT